MTKNGVAVVEKLHGGKGCIIYWAYLGEFPAVSYHLSLCLHLFSAFDYTLFWADFPAAWLMMMARRAALETNTGGGRAEWDVEWPLGSWWVKNRWIFILHLNLSFWCPSEHSPPYDPRVLLPQTHHSSNTTCTSYGTSIQYQPTNFVRLGKANRIKTCLEGQRWSDLYSFLEVAHPRNHFRWHSQWQFAPGHIPQGISRWFVNAFLWSQFVLICTFDSFLTRPRWKPFSWYMVYLSEFSTVFNDISLCRNIILLSFERGTNDANRYSRCRDMKKGSHILQHDPRQHPTAGRHCSQRAGPRKMMRMLYPFHESMRTGLDFRAMVGSAAAGKARWRAQLPMPAFLIFGAMQVLLFYIFLYLYIKVNLR